MSIQEQPQILQRFLDVLDWKSNCQGKTEESLSEEDNISLPNLIYENVKNSDQLMKDACGLYPNQLSDLAVKTKRSEQVIFEFLMICKQGISQHFAAVLNNKTQAAVSINFNNVLKDIHKNFVPLHLGASHFTRKIIEEEQTPRMWKEIWPNVKGAGDSAYLYSEKSSIFDVQKKSFNGQKKRNLWKFMALILPDGTAFDVLGPFFADGDHNDEWIWEYIVNNNIGTTHFTTTKSPG